jgi:outer membrane protein
MALAVRSSQLGRRGADMTGWHPRIRRRRPAARHGVLWGLAVAGSLISPAIARGQGASATPPLLSLPDAMALALANAEPALQATDAITDAEIGLRVARAAFQPKFGSSLLSTLGQDNLAGQTYGLSFSQRLLTGTEVRAGLNTTSSRNQLGTYWGSDTTFSVSQPMSRGFSPRFTRREITLAQERLAGARRQRALVEQRLAIEVAAAYWRIGAQNQLVALAEASAARARQLLEASRARLGAGKVSQLDVLRAEQLVAENDLQVLDARAAAQDAADQLRLLVGRGRDFVFAVAPEVSVPSAHMAEDEAEATAMDRRLEVAGATESVREAENAVWIAGQQGLPQVDLGVAWTRRETAATLRDSFGLDQFHFAGFATATLPFDRTAARAARESAQLDLDRRRRALANLRLSVAQEARRAVRQYERMRQGLGLVEASLDQARREAELALLRYDRGLSNNLDVVTAEANLLAATARRASMLGDLAVAWLQVRAAAGVLDPRADVR